ncbi:MAG TPA: cytochrome c3 family protein [Vicinamibacterales bacterium]|nr:cytochrome c3 family protein [Vicinamibacterales bacterium]
MRVLVAAAAILLLPQAVPAPVPEAGACLACHADPQLTMAAGDGTPVPVHVDPAVFAGSVHAALACADCHAGKEDVPHESRAIRSRRELTLAYDEQCRRCHFTNYTKTLDSVHQASVARGDRTAPVCVDCHGSHDIRSPAAPRTRISETCARCHQGAAVAYAKSVHGRLLGTEAAGDVPVCTDCHRSHDIGGPHQQTWGLSTTDVCGRCHANQPLMAKYGLSTSVLSTYLADFHGKTASLRQHQGTTPTGSVVARCIDCHGVHDIERANDPSSPVMKANLQKTCQKCHADANANFPDAWLSHYEPSLEKAPLVYGVKLAYAVLIPFMIGGLGLQILLHLWRLAVNR